MQSGATPRHAPRLHSYGARWNPTLELQGFPYTTLRLRPNMISAMVPDERMQRIKDWASQLGRAESPEVIATVAAHLKVAIDEYVHETERQVATCDMLLPLPSQAA